MRAETARGMDNRSRCPYESRICLRCILNQNTARTRKNTPAAAASTVAHKGNLSAPGQRPICPRIEATIAKIPATVDPIIVMILDAHSPSSSIFIVYLLSGKENCINAKRSHAIINPHAMRFM